MTGRLALILDSRAVLRAGGPDTRGFLQGMMSNDIEKLTPQRALWSAFLTPQGKFLHELFLTAAPEEDAVLIDCEAGRRDDLRRRLGIYKLRSRVTIEDAAERYAVAALFGADTLAALGLPGEPGRAARFAGGLVYVDPRLPALGARAVLPRQGAEAALSAVGFAPARPGDYDRLRISLGVPDGSRDLEVERSPLLENGFDELGGVDWKKGCFVGQELTARTKFRGLVKKRLLPVEIDGPPPAAGTPVMLGGKEAGIMRSVAGDVGLALLRLEHLERAAPGALTAGQARLTARKPDWARF
ncbi:MAG: YgfZ/GcvT domain-containing protein [Kiloniellaceae bacterium]